MKVINVQIYCKSATDHTFAINITFAKLNVEYNKA